MTSVCLAVTATRLGAWGVIGMMTAGSLAAGSLQQLKSMSIEELLELEVTSVSRSPIALGEAPSALQVITQGEIRRSGASSIPQALRLASNLQVGRKNAHDWAITARGFNAELANKLLVLIDGRAVYTPLWSGVRWDVQDTLLEDIDRIEVISGPGGSQWGANAVNGVINVTTKNARETQGLYLESGLGNQLSRFGAARYGGTLSPGTYFRVYVKDFERDDEVLPDGSPAGDAASVAQAGFRIDTDAFAQGAFTVQGDVYHGHEGVVGSGVGEVSGGNLLTRWTKVLADGSDVQLQLYYDRAYLRLPIAAGALGPAGSFEDDLETYDLDFQQRLSIGASHALVWGLGYRRIQDDSVAAPALGFGPAEVTQEVFSGFFQDQISIGGQSILTLGTKIEHNDYTGMEFEPSIRLQRDLGERNLLWAAVSRAVRMPSRIDRDLRQPNGVPVLAGSDDFDSETLIAYEAGLRGQLAGRIAGTISLFFNDYDRLRSIGPHPVTVLPYGVGNDLEGESHGVEVAFDVQLLDHWRLRGGYTFVKTDVRIRPGGFDLNNALNETADPEHQWALGSSWDLPGGFALDGRLRWMDTLRYNNGGQPARLPSYLELDLRLAVLLSDHLELSIVGENLLHDQHAEAGVAGPIQVEIARSVFAKLAWRY